MASRSIERVSASIQKMQESSPDKHLDLHFLKLDMENLSSIKSSVNEFTSKEQRLDILVNNAAARAPNPPRPDSCKGANPQPPSLHR